MSATKDTDDKVFIECDCGSHLLKIESHVEYNNFHPNDKTYSQDYYFAMFNYAEVKKASLWKRIKIAWDYLKTGDMHADQLSLTPDEMKKIGEFYNETVVETTKPNGQAN